MFSRDFRLRQEACAVFRRMLGQDKASRVPDQSGFWQYGAGHGSPFQYNTIMFKAEIRSLNEINNVAEKFLEAHPADRLFAFFGKMGSGKTTFIKAICEKLQVIDYVTSPTFALINVYETETEIEIYHFDFYRIKNMDEIFDLGYEEYFYSDHYCLIEWPELIEPLLPANTIRVHITEMESGSRLVESN